MTAPIIVTGTTEAGTTYAQLWHPSYSPFEAKYATPSCVASVVRDKTGIRFNILTTCPAEWYDHAVGMFTLIRRGLPVPATHTISWGRGTAEFTPLTPEVPEDEPTTLDGLEVGL